MRIVKIRYSGKMKTCKKCQQAKPLSSFSKNERYADGYVNWCKECHGEASAAWYEQNKERHKLRAVEWAKANPEAAKAIQKRHKDKTKERRAAQFAEWQKANRPKRNAVNARRKAALLRATPAWADQDAITNIYAEAMRQQEETGIRKHVDHIVPLQSKIVCGLHAESNLQILDGAENESKRNFRWPDMP
jgi:hypothetical protein